MSRKEDLYLRFFSRIDVSFRVAPPKQREYFLSHFSAHVVSLPAATHPHIEIRCVDAGIAIPEAVPRVTSHVAVSDQDIYLTDSHGRILHLALSEVSPWSIEAEMDFDPAKLMCCTMLCLHLVATQHGFAFIHSSAVAYNSRGFVFPAWNNTGKTILWLHLVRAGASLVGDDWCVISENGKLHSFLKSPILYPNDMRQHPKFLEVMPAWKRCLLKFLLSRLAKGKFCDKQGSNWERGVDGAVKRFCRLLGVDRQLLLPLGAISSLDPTESIAVHSLCWLTRCGSTEASMDTIEIDQLIALVLAAYKSELDALMPVRFFSASHTFERSYAAHLNRYAQVLSAGLRGKSCFMYKVPACSDDREVWQPLIDSVIGRYPG